MEPSGLRVRYVLDIAEIPSFQIMSEQGASNGWSARSMQAWADGEIALVRSGLRVRVGGTPVELTATGARARLRPGAGGLPTIYWTGEFVAPLQGAPRAHDVAVDDSVYADRRIGWKDVVVGSQTEPTSELQRYPSELLGSPRRITTATFTFVPPAGIANVVEQADASPASGSLTSWFAPSTLSEMFASTDRTPLFVMLTVLAAFGLGALHALEPGHGKALLAFTLVGVRATTRQAIVLALSLTFAHTIGVLLLGLVLFFASGFVAEAIYPWITLVSGVAIAIIGARTLARFISLRRGLAHSHSHAHDGAHSHAHEHAHELDHEHADGHGHDHSVPGSGPLRFSNAIWAAMSGGIAPCPAAIVVLLAALRLHQVGYGLALIVVFSAGLATVLSALGIGVVHGAAWLARRSSYEGLVRYGPLLSALVISTIGATLVGQGLSQQGVAASPYAIAALTLAAIVGYALARQGHAHGHASDPIEVQPA